MNDADPTGPARTFGPERCSASAGNAATPHAGQSRAWRGAVREIVIAAALVLTLGTAAWVLSGPVLAGLVVLGCAAAAILVLRALIGPDVQPAGPEDPYDGHVVTFAGFWRTQADLADATASLAAWHYSVRPRLQNLLAARLSERHGISLAEDPEAARQALLGTGGGRPGRRADLWQWIDPRQPIPEDAGTARGIPPAVLAALIDRLERL